MRGLRCDAPSYFRKESTPVNMVFIKIGVKALERASELCRLHSGRTFLRILVDRLAAANSKLSGILSA